MMRRCSLRSDFAAAFFYCLLLLGVALIATTIARAQSYCGQSPICFPQLGCSSVQGNCVVPNYDCGGPCPTAPQCNSWGDPCTCFYYNGRCSVPLGYVDGEPQYLSCTYSCCDTVMFCL